MASWIAMTEFHTTYWRKSPRCSYSYWRHSPLFSFLSIDLQLNRAFLLLLHRQSGSAVLKYIEQCLKSLLLPNNISPRAFLLHDQDYDSNKAENPCLDFSLIVATMNDKGTKSSVQPKTNRQSLVTEKHLDPAYRRNVKKLRIRSE
jgi:hypothetical protein